MNHITQTDQHREAPSLRASLSSLVGAKLDVSNQDWLPCPNLDDASLEQIRSIEDELSAQLPNQDARAAYVGRNRFEVLPVREAHLLSEDRIVSDGLAQLSCPSQRNTTLDTALASCVLIAGSGSRDLGQRIAARLGSEPGGLLVEQFANGETRIIVNESVRDKDVFIIQSGTQPVNDSFVELCLTVDALKRASARSITAVVPYFGYSRQDRKDKHRAPISARWAADMLEKSGVNRVVTIDIHAEQIEGFFSVPMDNLAGFPLMVPHLAERYGDTKITIVSPDAGGMKRAEAAGQVLARHLSRFSDQEGHTIDAEIRVEGMYKRRDKPGHVAESKLIGDGDSVRDATCILVDDMIDTGGSSVTAAKLLRASGARNIVLCATHPIFSKQCVERFRTATSDKGDRLIDEVVVTDTIPLRRGKGDLITVISVETLLAEAIRRVCKGAGASLRELQGFTGSFDH
jgi:ribose-phosphate pyrophosphokinase